jgi:hypothetical protein
MTKKKEQQYLVHTLYNSFLLSRLKVPKCEILISWIGRLKLKFYIFTDGLDTGHFVFATAYAVYASNLLPCAHYTLAIGYRMRSVR